MKYLLILWGLTGPKVGGVFHDEFLCQSLAETMTTPAVRFCASMEVDNLVFDVVQWVPPNKEK